MGDTLQSVWFTSKQDGPETVTLINAFKTSHPQPVASPFHKAQWTEDKTNRGRGGGGGGGGEANCSIMHSWSSLCWRNGSLGQDTHTHKIKLVHSVKSVNSVIRESKVRCFLQLFSGRWTCKNVFKHQLLSTFVILSYTSIISSPTKQYVFVDDGHMAN